MTDLTPTPELTPVPQLEVNTIALAGTGNPMNQQAQALANRDAYRGEQIEEISSDLQIFQDLLASGAGGDSIGFQRTALADAVNGTVRKMLSAMPRSIWEYSSLVTEKPSVSDPNTWDWTPAFAAAAAQGGVIRPGAGVFTLSSVPLAFDVIFECEAGTTFKRKNNIDVRQSYWNVGTAMFEIRTVPIRVIFSGGPTFDGNRQNQLGRYQEPSGFSVKIQPPDTVVPSAQGVFLYIGNASFVNGTSGYLPLRGDDSQRRYPVNVLLDGCSFSDTLYGTGKGDPSAITALGYQPDYVTCLDYVNLITNNLNMEFLQSCPLGFYAPCGIRGTYFGSSAATAGECTVRQFGVTTTKGMGRDARKWDDANDFVTNNGIGVFDLYGNGEELSIQHLIGVSNRNVTMRAKASTKRFNINYGVLKDCWRGVQVSPSTTGVSETVVTIGDLITSGGTIPQLEIVGTTTTDRVKSATIGSVFCEGANQNPESLTLNGAIRFRNITSLTVASATALNSATQGMTIVDVVDCNVNGIKLDTQTQQGLYLAGSINQVCNISGFDIRNSTLDGISIASGTTGDVNVSKGYVSGAVGSGVLGNSSACKLIVDAVHVDSITGTSRGFYSAGGDPIFTNNRVTNTTTPIGVAAGVRSEQRGNSWNPYVGFGTAAPTAGTWSRGDIIYNTAASASGNVGWICVTSGSPGTWKTFGTIAA